MVHTTTMKWALVLFAVFGCAFAEVDVEVDGTDIEYFLVDNEDGTYRVEDLVNSTIEARAQEDDVTFYLFTTEHPEGLLFSNADLSNLNRQGFNRRRDTIVIAHGWTNSYASPINTIIVAALLPNHPHNIIVVDWRPLARKNYITAKNAVVPVGGWVANLINNMVSTLRVNLDSIKLIGHSLGAHVMGNAGAALNGQVGVIVGLDPALPLFSYKDTSNRLDPTDAVHVQVMHTNGGQLGFSKPIGDSDFYPNGGKSQPGCILDVTGACAHNRAYEYLAESYFNDEFLARECSSERDFNRGRCSENHLSRMGGIYVDRTANGSYYLTTNKRSPYATGTA